jgi:hypothetical protein
MSRRALALMAVAVAAGGSVAAGAKTETLTVQYVGHRTGRAWGRTVMLLIVSPPKGKQTAALVVPNKDPMSHRLNPDPKVVKLVKTLKPGDLIEVRYQMSQGQKVLRQIRALKAKAEEPAYFTVVKVGSREVAGQEHLYVLVDKGGKQAELLVPNARGPDGKWVPEEKLARQARTFSHGDKVDVRVKNAAGKLYLQGIYPHASPVIATFVKREMKDIDGERHLCVIVKDEDGRKTLTVPNAGKDAKGKAIPDRELSAAAGRFRFGHTVAYKLYTEGDKTYLRELLPAKPKPKQPPPKK